VKAVEKTAKTVDEAVYLALQELGVSREDVEIDVLEEPSKGILGLIGVKPARVKVFFKEKHSRKAEKLINDITRVMQLEVEIITRESEKGIFIELKGPELGVLIGRRGETLEALQYLVNLSVNKGQEVRKKITIDIEGYRKRREETLQRLARKLADKAKLKRRNIVLEPMSPQERRIIHTTLQGRNDIYTFSEGEEPYRKIVISPKK
jgi:spoIIIJ-associated protein